MALNTIMVAKCAGYAQAARRLCVGCVSKEHDIG